MPRLALRPARALQFVRELHDQDAVLADEPHQRDEPDLRIDVERRKADVDEDERAEERHRHDIRRRSACTFRRLESSLRLSFCSGRSWDGNPRMAWHGRSPDSLFHRRCGERFNVPFLLNEGVEFRNIE